MPINFGELTISNAVLGLVIGFIVKSIMSLFLSTGALITQQIGFAAVRYFDPSSGQQIGPFRKVDSVDGYRDDRHFRGTLPHVQRCFSVIL